MLITSFVYCADPSFEIPNWTLAYNNNVNLPNASGVFNVNYTIPSDVPVCGGYYDYTDPLNVLPSFQFIQIRI